MREIINLNVVTDLRLLIELMFSFFLTSRLIFYVKMFYLFIYIENFSIFLYMILLLSYIRNFKYLNYWKKHFRSAQTIQI